MSNRARTILGMMGGFIVLVIVIAIVGSQPSKSGNASGGLTLSQLPTEAPVVNPTPTTPVYPTATVKSQSQPTNTVVVPIPTTAVPPLNTQAVNDFTMSYSQDTGALITALKGIQQGAIAMGNGQDGTAMQDFLNVQGTAQTASSDLDSVPPTGSAYGTLQRAWMTAGNAIAAAIADYIRFLNTGAASAGTAGENQLKVADSAIAHANALLQSVSP